MPSTTVAGTTVKCRKVHGWHGLKHPLFGYFYWKYILTIRWCWEAGGSLIVKTNNPWSPTFWRDVECCMQFSGWDFKGHTGLDVDGGAEQESVPRPGAGQVPAVLPVLLQHEDALGAPDRVPRRIVGIRSWQLGEPSVAC